MQMAVTPEVMSETKPAPRRRRQGGFSILELLIVLAIMALLGTLVGPRLFSQFGRAQSGAAETQVRMLKSALDTMRLDIGRYPTTDEGLQLLVTAPNDPDIKARWHGPYLDTPVPLDPWNHPYLYSPEGKDLNPIALYSYGPDGKPGGDTVGMPPRN
ncbi:MAG: type II secretion system major pseudopilin GspG [Aliidongia sp.]|jgi:general secretion pathway protein G